MDQVHEKQLQIVDTEDVAGLGGEGHVDRQVYH